MSRKARIRAAAAAAVALAIGLLFATGTVQGVYASFSAETENPGSAFAGGWIPPATGLSTSIGGASNSTVTLNWTSGYNATAGTPGNHISGQQPARADGGSGASASCGSYTNVGGSLGTGIGTTTDTGGSNTAADWWCYQITETTTAPNTWSTTTAFTPLKLLVVTSVVVANGGSGTRRMNNGDTITITFNQNVNAPAANHFCGINNGTNDAVYLGDTRATGTCVIGDTYSIGKITGLTVSASQLLTESVSQPLPNQIKVQITQNSTSTATFGTPVFTPAAGVTNGTIGACTSTATPTCTVTPTGTF